jgi:hypothetical protein
MSSEARKTKENIYGKITIHFDLYLTSFYCRMSSTGEIVDLD